MNTDNYRDLLIVNVNEKLYVVEAPSHEANVGDMVEFLDEWKAPHLGTVIDKTFAVKGEEEWRCWSMMHIIYPAKRILKTYWEAETQ